MKSAKGLLMGIAGAGASSRLQAAACGDTFGARSDLQQAGCQTGTQGVSSLNKI